MAPRPSMLVLAPAVAAAFLPLACCGGVASGGAARRIPSPDELVQGVGARSLMRAERRASAPRLAGVLDEEAENEEPVLSEIGRHQPTRYAGDGMVKAGEIVKKDWNCGQFVGLDSAKPCTNWDFRGNPVINCVSTIDECAQLADVNSECSKIINYFGNATGPNGDYPGRCLCVSRNADCDSGGWKQKGGTVAKIAKSSSLLQTSQDAADRDAHAKVQAAAEREAATEGGRHEHEHKGSPTVSQDDGLAKERLLPASEPLPTEARLAGVRGVVGERGGDSAPDAAAALEALRRFNHDVVPSSLAGAIRAAGKAATRGAKTRARQEHRVGIVLPWVGPPMPDGLGLVCRSVAPSHALVDLLIITEVVGPHNPVPGHCKEAANVKVIDLGKDGLARRFAERLGKGGAAERPELEQVITGLLQTNPWSAIAFKPALGHVFEAELANYTHWGYSDADLLFGDLRHMVTDDELEDYDVVSYTAEGDLFRLYLRGQWTVFKNEHRLRHLFEACPTLSTKLLPSLKMFQERLRTSTSAKPKTADEVSFSAEGCISSVVLSAPGVRVKFAPKMFTDHARDPVYWKGGRLCRGQAAACAAGLVEEQAEGLCSPWRSPTAGQRKEIQVTVADEATCTKACTPEICHSDFRWVGPYSNCVAPDSWHGQKWDAYDFVERDADGRFWHVPVGSLSTLCPRNPHASSLAATPGGSDATEAAIFHYRVWQDVLKDVRMNEQQDGTIVVSTKR